MAGLDALRATFFEECQDLLARMADDLARLTDGGSEPDMEAVHGIFRAVHSVKGGAGAFALHDLVGFSHVFETVLDRIRSGKLTLMPAVLQTLLRAYDVLSDLVACAQSGAPLPALRDQLLKELDQLAETHPGAEVAEAFDFQPLAIDISSLALPPAPDHRDWTVQFHPTAAAYAAGHEPAALLRALSALGSAQITAGVATVPPLSQLDLRTPNLHWGVRLTTASPCAEIEAVFDFVGELAQIQIAPVAEEAQAAAPPATSEEAESIPQATPRAAEPSGSNILPFAPTIRVNLDRVDRLINQIGELVIMEAMLSQAVATAGLRDDSDFASSLDGIKQLAADIQESVMAIRAQPLKPVFQRMQRIAREASDATGKQVRLFLQGEMTEVDRTVIERLVDPLTHMIRNSVDHGIEPATDRLAAGKPPEGRITLSAAHRSGRVVIEVADDGRGIDRTRVREIAEARGLVPQGAVLTAAEIDSLLFLPGFSSRDEVSALSGRGVGLDVVRREIQSLGGRVTIQSCPGKGTAFTIALPLTLAVLEGMLIRVADQTMVLPLSAILETIRPSEGQIHQIGPGSRVIANRGELIPVIDLADTFGFARAPRTGNEVFILVECDSGQRAALIADHIQDQRQVVMKSLEENYGSIRGISAATILGDGRVALIIDPEEIVLTFTKGTSNHPLAANGLP